MGIENCVGSTVVIRTVTMTLVGQLDAVGPQELALSAAHWIADTAPVRWGDLLRNGLGGVREIEALPGTVYVGRGAVVDLVSVAWQS